MNNDKFNKQKISKIAKLNKSIILKYKDRKIIKIL